MRGWWVACLLLLAGCMDGGKPLQGGDVPETEDCPEPCMGSVKSSTAWEPPTSSSAPDADLPAGGRPLGLSCPDPCVTSHRFANVWEPHGTGNPSDPDHFVVVFKTVSPDIITLVTFDGGDSWREGVLKVGPSAPASVLRQYTHSGDQTVAILPDGTVLVTALGVNITEVPGGAGSMIEGRAIFVARSGDGGLTFDEAVEVTPGAGRQAGVRVAGAQQSVFTQFVNSDKEWIAVAPDGKTALLAWTAIRATQAVTGNGPVYDQGDFAYDVMAAVSRDGGMTWTQPARLEQDTTWAAAHPAVSSDGSMMVAYGNPFGGLLFSYTSSDGTTWEKDGIGTIAGQPIARALASPGHFAVAYPALVGDWAWPIVRTSADGGRTWSNATVLDGDIGPYFTNMAFDVAPDGTAFVGWYKDENDTLSYNVAALIPGATEFPTLRLASGLVGPSRQVGDYMAVLSARPNGAMVGWVAILPDGAESMDFARVTLG